MTTTSGKDSQLCWAHDWLTAEHDIEQVPVASLQLGQSLRSKGESKSHIKVMAELGEMPPIIVHRTTMTVIDGRHRLAAAQLAHRATIAVRFIDGITTDEAYVLAVKANVTHGLSLSMGDRKAAATRIIGKYPDSSNRAIAATTGLSHNTVAAIRRKWPTGQIDQLARRRGRDGKSRPLSTNDGRQAAAELIRAGHNKSLREIAKEANVSRGTVEDVRDRLARGVSPLVSKTRGAGLDYSLARGQTALERLRTDPSVRSHEDGKVLLRLSSDSLRFASVATALSRRLPQHCWYAVAELAAALSDAWSRIAQELRALIQAG